MNDSCQMSTKEEESPAAAGQERVYAPPDGHLASRQGGPPWKEERIQTSV